MNDHKGAEDKLGNILKTYGLEKPGTSFSHQLAAAVVRQRQAKAQAAFKAGRWLGKVILGILVFFNLLFLCYLNPFPEEPALFISVLAFVGGIWGVIAVAGRVHWPTLHDR